MQERINPRFGASQSSPCAGIYLEIEAPSSSDAPRLRWLYTCSQLVDEVTHFTLDGFFSA